MNNRNFIAALALLSFHEYHCCKSVSQSQNRNVRDEGIRGHTISFIGFQLDPSLINGVGKQLQQRQDSTHLLRSKGRYPPVKKRVRIFVSGKAESTLEEQQILYRELHKVNTAAFFLGVRGKGCGRSEPILI